MRFVNGKKRLLFLFVLVGLFLFVTNVHAEEGSILDGIVDFIVDACKLVYHWIVEGIKSVVYPLVNWIMSFVPGDYTPDFTDLKYYFEIVNYWVPLDFAFSLATIYITFILVLSTIRTIVKFIPFIG